MRKASSAASEILIEVHSYYKKRVEIASKVDRVYDFALPPLLLHSREHRYVEPVAHWTDIRPNNAVTVLDTHDWHRRDRHRLDQLDRSLKGLRADGDVDNLVNTIHANTHGESQARHRRTAASNLDLYQVNSTYYSRARIATTSTTFMPPARCSSSCRALPQVYYRRRACRQETASELLRKTEQRPRHQPPLPLRTANRREPQASGRQGPRATLCEVPRNELDAFVTAFFVHHR